MCGDVGKGLANVEGACAHTISDIEGLMHVLDDQNKLNKLNSCDIDLAGLLTA